MGKPKVAFVDDEVELTEAYQELFESKYQIKTFPSAEKYLAYLDEQKHNPFDVTVTDFKMEKINGLEMINTAIDQKLSCPFIMVSGHVDQDMLNELVNPKAIVTLLEKPPDIQQLESTIEKALQQIQKIA